MDIPTTRKFVRSFTVISTKIVFTLFKWSNKFNDIKTEQLMDCKMSIRLYCRNHNFLLLFASTNPHVYCMCYSTYMEQTLLQCAMDGCRFRIAPSAYYMRIRSVQWKQPPAHNENLLPNYAQNEQNLHFSN